MWASHVAHILSPACVLAETPSDIGSFTPHALLHCALSRFQQWGAVDSEIKAPSDENTELKGSPLKAWSRSEYCHACYAYCQGFLPC